MITTGFSLLLVAVAGGLTLEIAGNRAVKNLNIILAFGGAYIMGLLFLHLVPEAFSYGTIAGSFVLIGFLVQILLEYISKGLEHGHVHVHGDKDHSHNVLPWAAFLSLCLHAFLESMPLAEGTAETANHVRTMGQMQHNHVHVTATSAMDSALFMGLAFHKFPVALVLMSLIKSTNFSVVTRWGLLVVFGLMPWFGMELYDYIIHSTIRIPGGMNAFMAAIHGLVIGILLHVATTVLFETGDGHTFNFKKLMATLVGLAIAYFTLS